jgi:hypothetical protein
MSGLETPYITHTIWDAWTHSGIVLIIENGSFATCTLDQDRILREPVLNHRQPPYEKARGRAVQHTKWVVLNAD